MFDFIACSLKGSWRSDLRAERATSTKGGLEPLRLEYVSRCATRGDTQPKSESREQEAKSEPTDKKTRQKGRTPPKKSEATEEKEKKEQEDKKQRSELA